MISMKDCLIPNQDFTSHTYNHASRFPAGFYQPNNNKGFKTHVKTQLLSPSITYTVNLVFMGSNDRYGYVGLKYRLSGEPTTSTVYLGNRREESYMYMAELYQFTSDGTTVDLEIDFDDHGTTIDGVEGILFQPLEIGFVSNFDFDMGFGLDLVFDKTYMFGFNLEFRFWFECGYGYGFYFDVDDQDEYVVVMKMNIWQ
nr:protein kinase-like domain, phloem protein 2-like protein [Tanacetum cinerariifolium]